VSAAREVHARRARLVERAATERDELAGLLLPWQKPLSAVDRGLAIARGIKRTAPLLGFAAGVGMAALAFIRPEGISGWFHAVEGGWRALTGRSRTVARVAGAIEAVRAAGEAGGRLARAVDATGTEGPSGAEREAGPAAV
jgi:hypothetical protein